jgi:hypothetical protein
MRTHTPKHLLLACKSITGKKKKKGHSGGGGGGGSGGDAMDTSDAGADRRLRVGGGSGIGM